MIEKPVSAPPPGSAPLGLGRGLLLFAPIAILGNFIGQWMRYPELGSAVVFPPYAALTAALLLSPRRDWVWYVAVHVAALWPSGNVEPGAGVHVTDGAGSTVSVAAGIA